MSETAQPSTAVPPHCDCPRHALLKPLLMGIGWLTALVLALSVSLLKFDLGESLCGTWGCFPPLPPLVAMHLFWGVIVSAVLWGVNRWKPTWLWRGGWVVLSIALAVTVVYVGRNVLDWFTWTSEDEVHFWPRRAMYVIATKSDLPFVQVILASIASLILSARKSAE